MRRFVPGFAHTSLKTAPGCSLRDVTAAAWLGGAPELAEVPDDGLDAGLALGQRDILVVL